MTTTGLVSVTFRKLPPDQIIDLVARVGLRGIEWGGDVHVPHGEAGIAHEVRRMTHDAGLSVIAYGSYFRCRPGEAVEPIVETASALGAPLIRVWAGDRPSTQADQAYRDAIAEQSRHTVQLAEQVGIAVAYEFHANTLTDTAESAMGLLQAVPGMKTLWQPPHDLDEDERLRGLRALLPWLANVHVFHWRMPDRARLQLSKGEALWRERLRVVAEGNRDLAALLEFVRDDDPEQFVRDAHTLRSWLTGITAYTPV